MAVRRRSKQRPKPTGALVPGRHVDAFPPGLVPGDASTAGAVIARDRTGANLETADEVKLAMHLVRDLLTFVRNGKERENVRPALRAYLDHAQSRRRQQLSRDLMCLAWEAAKGQMAPERAFALAAALRGEDSWETEIGVPASLDDVKDALRKSRRGAKTTTRLKAERVYRVFAWNSAADVQPQKEARRDRANPVTDLLDEVEAFEQLRNSR